MKDLLDQNLIEYNSFVPKEVEFVPTEAIREVKNIIECQLANYDVQVKQEISTEL